MKVLEITKSPVKYKKYRARVKMEGEDRERYVDFGDVRYQHFKDSTPLKLYSHLDHGDVKRLHAFYQRHSRNNGPAAELSKHYLW